MAKTKLFISHSTKDDAARTRRDALRAGLEAAGYEILVAEDDIESGEHWRRRIHEMVADCEAALFLFNPDAVRSPWVLKEASILSWRKDVEGKAFHLLTALLDGVEKKVFDQKRWTPLLLNELQHELSDDVDAIVAAVVAQVPTERQAKSLLDRITDEIVAQLQRVDDTLLENAAGEHDLPELASHTGRSRKTIFAQRFARFMLRTGPDAAQRAVRVLDSISKTLDPSVAHGILSVLCPLWVEADAAALVARASARDGFRDLALCSQDLTHFSNHTGSCYVERAYPLSQLWRVLSVDDAYDEDLVTYAAEAIRDQMKEKVPSLVGLEGDLLDRMIKALTEPMFVLLPCVPDDVDLGTLRADWPRTTFLMFTEEQGEHRAPLTADARYVDPELDPTTETLAYAARLSADGYVTKLRK